MTKFHELLKQISERAEKATPKYSTEHAKMKHFKNYLIGVDCCDEEPFVIADMNRSMENWNNDLSFISKSRTDIPRLVKALECAIRQRDLSMQELLSARYPAERTDKTADGIKSIYNRELAAILEGE